jgi:hypothetical protein
MLGVEKHMAMRIMLSDVLVLIIIYISITNKNKNKHTTQNI